MSALNATFACPALLVRYAFPSNLETSCEIEIKVLEPTEEIYMSTAVFLWQYLLPNSVSYFLALSGGLDSCTTALMVFGMARLVLESVKSSDKRHSLIQDV